MYPYNNNVNNQNNGYSNYNDLVIPYNNVVPYNPDYNQTSTHSIQQPNPAYVYTPPLYNPPQNLLSLFNQETKEQTDQQEPNSLYPAIPSPSLYPAIPSVPSNFNKIPDYIPMHQEPIPETKSSFLDKPKSIIASLFNKFKKKFEKTTENKSSAPVVANNTPYAPSAPLLDETTPPTSNKETIEINPQITVIKEPVVESIKPKPVNSDFKRIISYVDLTFSEEIKNANTYEDVRKSLPEHALRDVLRHLSRYTIIEGKVEKMIENYNNGEIKAGRYNWINVNDQLQPINSKKYTLQPVGISEELISKGEEILKTHYELPVRMYSGNPENYELHNKQCDRAHEQYRAAFTDYINQIKGTSLFFQYLYEQAIAANIHIGDWDKQYAEHNWNKEGMHMLSIQALERCLHGQK